MNTFDPIPSSSGSCDLDAQVESMRMMFGSPVSIAATLLDSPAARVMSNPAIVIVDDEPINIKVVKKYLKLAGYRQFFTTTDSTEALDLINETCPDVVLLDIMMPHVSGLRILEKLRADRQFADLPVLILTAATDTETKLDSLRLGATDFLSKPVDSTELEARLRNVLRVKAHQDHLKNHAWDLELQVAARSAEVMAAHHEVIACLAKVGEYRDNETGRHVIRVGHYAEIIAGRLGLGAEVAERIRLAASLHDIGKVAIPDATLLKPGKLTAEEFDQMKQHTEFGRQICAMSYEDSEASSLFSRAHMGKAIASISNSPILKMAASIAQTHHEKWDGSGYLGGLAGEEIPIEGRIVAVADVFDALTSERPYKEAFSLEKSLGIIREQNGSHFDPAVTEAFFAEIDAISRIHAEYSDRPADPSPSPSSPTASPA